MVEKKATTKTAAKKTATKKATAAKTATATKKTSTAKKEVIYLTAENAGFRAGDVYQALAAAEQSLSLEEIAKQAKISVEDAILGIGWLFKDLKALLNHMIEMGLSSKERQEGIYFAESLEQIKHILSNED